MTNITHVICCNLNGLILPDLSIFKDSFQMKYNIVDDQKIISFTFLEKSDVGNVSILVQNLGHTELAILENEIKIYNGIIFGILVLYSSFKSNDFYVFKKISKYTLKSLNGGGKISQKSI